MISGVWVPLVTPFKDGQVDLASYRRLIAHYLACGVAGLFPLGTTGEAPTLDEDEADAVVEATIETVAERVPVFVGIGGNATRKVIKAIDRLSRFAFPGIVSVCPYYNRPTQGGLLQHFADLSTRPTVRSSSTTFLIGPRSTLPTTLCYASPNGRTLSGSRTARAA